MLSFFSVALIASSKACAMTMSSDLMVINGAPLEHIRIGRPGTEIVRVEHPTHVTSKDVPYLQQWCQGTLSLAVNCFFARRAILSCGRTHRLRLGSTPGKQDKSCRESTALDILRNTREAPGAYALL